VLLAGLTTGHKVGLGVVALVFIVFALSASFLAPRRRPDFPSRNGLSVFIIGSLVLFAAMLTAVVVFGKESEAKGAEGAASEQGAAAATIPVRETEFHVGLPALKELRAGKYTFVAHNAGKVPHDLAIEGPHVAGTDKTALIQPGGSAKLTVSLEAGTYTLYCTVPGHRQAGMVARLSVG
jgi:plastocyanin